MSTSRYFNNYSGHKIGEQRLYEDVIAESIRIMGADIYYLPRESWGETDMIFGENVHSKFDKAYQMEMYLANVEGYEGDNEFLSKFGLEIRDNSNFIVSRLTFEKYVSGNIRVRPQEGDLIYVPVLSKIFEIKFVEEELLFFSLGQKRPYVYELRCEAFRYANEVIDTGVDVIDDIQANSSYTIKLDVTSNGNFYIGETIYQGANLANATATAKVSNWDAANGDLYVYEVKGTFTSNTIVGVTSNVTSYVSDSDILGDYVYNDVYNNADIQGVANNIVIIDSNPFGTP